MMGQLVYHSLNYFMANGIQRFRIKNIREIRVIRAKKHR